MRQKQEEARKNGEPVEEEAKNVPVAAKPAQQAAPQPKYQEPTKEEVEQTAKAYLEKKPVDPSVEEISTYNGAKTQKYNWSQQIRGVDVQMKLPEGICKSKQLNVKIEAKKIFVAVKGKESEPLL